MPQFEQEDTYMAYVFVPVLVSIKDIEYNGKIIKQIDNVAETSTDEAQRALDKWGCYGRGDYDDIWDKLLPHNDPWEILDERMRNM